MVLTVNCNNKTPKLVSIAISPETKTVPLGRTQQYTAIGTYSDASTQNITASVHWSSSNLSVASMNANGLANTLQQGDATISASLENIIGNEASLTVSAPELTSIAITPEVISIAKGQTQQYQAMGTYTDGTSTDITAQVQWHTSEPNIITINALGLATGVSIGEGFISASLNDIFSNNANLNVGPAILVSIQVTPVDATLTSGHTQQYTALGMYSDGSTQDITQSVTWNSSNKSIAPIDATGLVTGSNTISPAITIITASLGDVSANTSLTVTPRYVISMVITPANASIAKGLTQQFQANVTYNDNSTENVTTQADWDSSNDAVTFSSSTGEKGLAYAAKVGSVTITATFAGTTLQVNFTISPPTLVSIPVTSNNDTIAKGLTQQYTATGSYTDGSQADITTGVSWESLAPGIATINASGVATGIAQGTTTIKASLFGIEGALSLNVGAPNLVSIEVSPATASIARGLDQAYTATGHYTDGSTQDITNQASWYSSNFTPIPITHPGIAHGADVGNSNISASLNGITSNLSLITVTDPELVSIRVDPSNASITRGSSQAYSAFGIFTDGSQLDITAEANWQSENPNVASISNDDGSEGLVSTVSQGSTNITASMSGISGSTTLTVLLPVHTVNVNVSIPSGTVKIANKGANEQTASSGPYQFTVEENADFDITATNAPSNQTCVVTNGSGTMGVVDVTAQVTCTVNQVPVQVNVSGLIPEYGYLVVENNDLEQLEIGNNGISNFPTPVDEDGNYSVKVITSPDHQTCVPESPSSGNASASGVVVNITCTNLPAVLQSISINPSIKTITDIETQPFTAIAHYDYGPDVDLTSQAVWSSSNESTATIGPNTGIAVGSSPGETTITATYGGISATAALTVTSHLTSISAPGALLLFPQDTGTPITSKLTITNTSTTNAATNITASLPGDWSDVTQDASNCVSVNPGDTCTLSFTPTTSQTHDSADVIVSGNNTNTLTIKMGVNRPYGTNGVVNAMVPDLANNVIYFGGNFTYVGPNTGFGVPIDASGQALSSFPRVNGVVNAVIPDGNGGWYIGGSFTSVGGKTRNRIAHILSDYSVDTDFAPSFTGSSVFTLALNGNTLYAGGSFTAIGGQSRSNLAALCTADNCDGNNTAAGNATNWNPNVNNTVNALAFNGSILYVGGIFSNIGGQSRNNLAAFAASTGSLISWNPFPNGSVLALAINGNTLYAGGSFNAIGGQTRNRIAAICITVNCDGNNTAIGAATSWNPNAGNTVLSLAINGNTLYAGGTFSTIGGQPRTRIAAICITANCDNNNTAAGASTNWNPNAGGNVAALAIQNNTIYASGTFTTIGGQNRNFIAALDANGNGTNIPYVTNWDPNANSSVLALALDGNIVYAGGGLTSIGGKTRSNIAALEASTGKVTNWNPSSNGAVNALAIKGNIIYAGGNFTNIGGQARNHIASLDSSTGNALDWDPNANGTVQTLGIMADTLYIGGGFTSIGGQTRNSIAAVNLSTGSVTAWAPNANSTSVVNTFAFAGNTIYVGGSFTSIGGQTRGKIAALDVTTGNAIANWSPSANGTVNTLALDGDTLYVGGSFTLIGGQSRNNIAALDVNGNGTTAPYTTNWNPIANTNVNTITLYGSTIYAGGAFTTIGGQSRSFIAALYTTGDGSTIPYVTAWNPIANNSVFSLTIIGNTVYMSGNFLTIGGDVSTRIAIIPLP